MPLLLIDAIDGAVDVHNTEALTSFVDPSEYDPVATNCCRVPKGMLGVDGLTAIDVKLIGAGLTVRLAVPLIAFFVAVIVALPGPTLVAMPAASIVTTPGAEELQVTCEVRS
jgi:hypothetical protein